MNALKHGIALKLPQNSSYIEWSSMDGLPVDVQTCDIKLSRDKWRQILLEQL
jgi:hypothetical protein